VSAKLEDLRFEADKLIEYMGRQLNEQRNFINSEINRGMRDNAHHRRLFYKKIVQLTLNK